MTREEKALLLALGAAFRERALKAETPHSEAERDVVGAYLVLKAAYEAEIDPLNPQTPE